MSYLKSEVFQNRLGLLVKWYNDYKALSENLDETMMSAAYTNFANASQNDRESLERLLGVMMSQRDALQAQMAAVAAEAQRFLTVDVAGMIGSTATSIDGLLADLRDAMNHASPADKVTAITVTNNPGQSNGSLSVDITLASGSATPNANLAAVTEMARDQNHFVVTCIDDSTRNAESWSVVSTLLGQAPDNLITGQNFAWDQAGIATLNVLPLCQSSGSAISGANSQVTGVVPGSNADVGGVLHAVLAPVSSSQVKDTYQQVADAGSLSAVWGTDTDVDGRIYLSVIADPAQTQVFGGTAASFTNIALTGLTKDNLPDGYLYAKVTSAGNVYTVNLYNNSDRAVGHLVATGQVTTTTFPAMVTMSAGGSGSGISGSLQLTMTAGATTDTTCIIQPQRFRILVYCSAARNDTDLRGEGISYVPSPASPVNITGSSISGSCTLRYACDDSDICYQLPFNLVKLYSDSSHTVLVGQAGHTSTGVPYPIQAINGSGLGGHLQVATASGEVTLTVGYGVGSKFTFDTGSADNGTFQCFFRDVFGQTLPSQTTGTIQDAWAESDGFLNPMHGYGIFNIRNYGAKINGTDDDTAAVNAAIAAAQEAGGGVVFHPGGICRCDGKLVINYAGGTAANDPPTQPPLRFLGIGNYTSAQGGTRCDHAPSGGSIYDLRYAGGIAAEYIYLGGSVRELMGLPPGHGIHTGQRLTLTWSGGTATCVVTGTLVDTGVLVGEWMGGEPSTPVQVLVGRAKLASLGFGSIEIANLTLMDGTAGAGTTNPFIVVTNTRAHIHDCTFWGNPDKSGLTCDQDAIVLGGPDNKGVGHDWDLKETSPFQGYGTVIENNFFNRIRRAVFIQTYGNGIVVQNNCIWQQCGSGLVDGAAFEILGHTDDSYKVYGTTIVNNLVEMGGYPYGIKLAYCKSCIIGPNHFYDPSATTLAYIRAELWATFNTIQSGFSSSGYAFYSAGANCAPNLVWNFDWSATPFPSNVCVDIPTLRTSQALMVSHGGDNGTQLVFDNAGGSVNVAAAFQNFGTVWTSDYNNAGRGVGLTIDTGRGGSTFKAIAYNHVFRNHLDTLDLANLDQNGVMTINGGIKFPYSADGSGIASGAWYDNGSGSLVKKA